VSPNGKNEVIGNNVSSKLGIRRIRQTDRLARDPPALNAVKAPDATGSPGLKLAGLQPARGRHIAIESPRRKRKVATANAVFDSKR
jgi:hypothetical protein